MVMNMKIISRIGISSGSVLLAVLFSLHAQGFQFVGNAFDPNTGELIYKEHHKVSLNQNQEYLKAQVIYKDKQGEVFAQKQLDFSDALLVPKVSFTDTRSQVTLNIQRQQDVVMIQYQDQRDSLKADVRYQQKMVVDAGFDQLLLENWDKVLSGETLKFDFLAPTRGQLIGFSLIPTIQTDSIIQFDLEPSNFLISLLVDPIKLTYDKRNRRILRYEGLTNIEDISQDGEYFVAKIEYEYAGDQ